MNQISTVSPKVGRLIDVEVFGLSFEEFLNFKNRMYYLDRLDDSPLTQTELRELYEEYVLYGAYPQVVHAETLELKELYLSNILEKYVLKDIRDLAHIRDVKKFNALLHCLAYPTGQLINVNELAGTLSLARQTVQDYLFILENTYIIKLLHPYHQNLRSEFTKMPKLYFEDTGIANLLKNKKLTNALTGDLFENSVYTCLRRSLPNASLAFWRTTAKQEVDFIISSATPPVPLEAKLQYQDKYIKSVRYFQEKYAATKAYCVTYTKNENQKYREIMQMYPWEIGKV